MKNTNPKNDKATGEGGKVEKTESNKLLYSNPESDLFPELLPPIAAARMPAIGSRADDALQAVLRGPLNQADYWKSWRLGASIKSLQYDGWEFIKRNTLKPGCRGPVTEYELDRTAPAVRIALEHHQLGFVTGEFVIVILMAASIVSTIFWLVSVPI